MLLLPLLLFLLPLMLPSLPTFAANPFDFGPPAQQIHHERLNEFTELADKLAEQKATSDQQVEQRTQNRKLTNGMTSSTPLSPSSSSSSSSVSSVAHWTSSSLFVPAILLLLSTAIVSVVGCFVYKQCTKSRRGRHGISGRNVWKEDGVRISISHPLQSL